MNILYKIILYAVLLPAKLILSLFLPKLKIREQSWRAELEKLAALPKLPNGKRLWFHSSSMGEFEQAKPIIEQIKAKYPNWQIICSFYSPSGFVNQQHYSFASAVLYMPFDTVGNARFFINSLEADVAVFVRYDAWRNHLLELRKRAIPIVLINATEPSKSFWNQIFIAKAFYKSNYSLFDKIFTVGQIHTDYFASLGVSSELQTSSDTRFDRIMDKVEQTIGNEILPQEIFEDKFVLVAGSIWKVDFEILSQAIANINSLSQKITTIYVPHEPDEDFLNYILAKLQGAWLLSDLLSKIERGDKISIASGGAIIVDSIGKLLKLYGNASFAYIGGAFGVGVHSLTEPAGYGIPLSCGENCFNSPDALALINAEALSPISNSAELEAWLRTMIENESIRQKTGQAANEYISNGRGSSMIIAQEIVDIIID